MTKRQLRAQMLKMRNRKRIASGYSESASESQSRQNAKNNSNMSQAGHSGANVPSKQELKDKIQQVCGKDFEKYQKLVDGLNAGSNALKENDSIDVLVSKAATIIINNKAADRAQKIMQASRRMNNRKIGVNNMRRKFNRFEEEEETEWNVQRGCGSKDRQASRRKNMRRTAALKKADVYMKRLASALENRTEKILADAEELVKQFFPARYVSAALTKLQKKLSTEGINCAFDKRVTKASIKKTAGSDITKAEVDEAIDYIANAVVAETEETLDACDNKIKSLAKKHFAGNRVSTTYRMRKGVEAKLNANGLRFKF